MSQMRGRQDVMELIGQLENCATEAEAVAQTKMVVETLGANWFVYTTLLPSVHGQDDDSFHYFIGCKPELCALYTRRVWMMNDPFFEYARSHTAPILGSKIRLQTDGQREMLAAGERFGFRSGIVIPTHTSRDANKRMGLLYIGSELAPEMGEPLLLQKRIQFEALGRELLHWWNVRLRKQAMRKFSLEDDEVEILELSKKGKVANEIAAIYDITLSAAYKRLNSLKEKFNVDKIDQAVEQADALGLFG
jgi:DNA-binding CsgD family transcriptional regulator